jgi:CheY-like chemotaxis protein
MNRILAIEPDPDRGRLLRQLLRDHLNGDVVLATSADVAIAAMSEQQPDLILTSMLLSASEEQDLVTHLRSTPSARHLPVLTVPAMTDPSTRETRPSGLLAKLLRRREPEPWLTFNTNAVIARIEDALEQSKIAAQAIEDAHMSVEPIDNAPIAARLEPPVVSSGTRKRARRLPKSDVPWLSSLRLSWGQSLRLLNISSSGVLVESGMRLWPGDVAQFQIAGTDLDLVVPARVVRCRVSEVSSLGVKYETAAVFEHPLDALIVSEQAWADTEATLDDLVAAVRANAACGIPAAELRTAFETGVLDLVTAGEVRLRDVPVAESDGRESIYFTVPTLDGSPAVLQITFSQNDAPRLEDFEVLTAAAQAAAAVLPLTGAANHAAANSRETDLQIV